MDDCNKNEWENPRAYLVEVSESITREMMSKLERMQCGAGRIGGSWMRIMQDGNIEHTLISKGRKSDYTEKDYDESYDLISGNY